MQKEISKEIVLSLDKPKGENAHLTSLTSMEKLVEYYLSLPEWSWMEISYPTPMELRFERNCDIPK